jgi:hypothetical protein
LLRMLGAAHADSTLTSYTSAWNQFHTFCRARGLASLPATPETVALYIAHLYDKGTIQPSSAAPYLSAINTAHCSLGHAPPADCELVRQARMGWRRLTHAEPGAQRVRTLPLPASIALRALRETAAVPMVGDPRALALQMRPLLFVALSFAILLRAGSGVSLTRLDVAVVGGDERGVRVLPSVIKGGQTAPQKPLPKSLPTAHVAALADAIMRYRTLTGMAWTRARATPPAAASRTSFWLLPGEDLSGSESTIANRWLREALDRLSVAAPSGGKYTSHSMRKGGASAAFAAGLSLAAICALGDWLPGSPVPMKHYIDLTVVVCTAAKYFFGWRVRPAS